MRAVVSLVLLGLLCVVFAGDKNVMSSEYDRVGYRQDFTDKKDPKPMFQEAPLFDGPMPSPTTPPPTTTTPPPTTTRQPTTLPPRLPIFNRVPFRPTFLPKVSTRSLGGNWVQAFVDDKSPVQCPFGAIEKNKHVGGGDTRRQSNYFLSKNLKLAASCRLDCMSQVAGQLHFDGGCKQRFFYYANANRCQVASELDDTQAKLAETYCMRCNGCVKTHNRAFNAASAKGAVGDNSAKLPH
ncbi:cell surface glycoprotein [Acrasis kona]|uniref:Cell surface glycoprotein n=1 Tax=Acrasis kona TaxID=1008807 RepID=A0AAW2YYR3_9EUKA